MSIYYGLDIGGTKIELAVFNEQLEKLYKIGYLLSKSSCVMPMKNSEKKVLLA